MGPADRAYVRFAYSPLWECVAAFRAWMDPGRHALLLPWMSLMLLLLIPGSKGSIYPNERDLAICHMGGQAAQYLTIHRNSLSYENERQLEFCWGIRPEWLHNGTQLSVKRAATKSGAVGFRLERSG